MNTILSNILNNTYTIGDLKTRIRALKSRLNHQIFGSPPVEENPDIASWLNGLGEDFYQLFNKDNVSAKLLKLEQEATKIEPLILYLAFEPDEKQIKELGIWTRQNINPAIILDIKYNPELIAGAAIVWKGNFRDYSLRYTIDQNKQQILTSFRGYLR